jgi:hypothetical protein
MNGGRRGKAKVWHPTFLYLLNKALKWRYQRHNMYVSTPYTVSIGWYPARARTPSITLLVLRPDPASEGDEPWAVP